MLSKETFLYIIASVEKDCFRCFINGTWWLWMLLFQVMFLLIRVLSGMY